MEQIKKYSKYIPVAFLIAAYVGHAVEALLGSEEYFNLVGVLGLSGALTTVLVYGIFPLDGGVALLLAFKNKIAPKLSWFYLYLWAGIWPWVPRVLEVLGGYPVEYGGAIAISVAAILAYKIQNNRSSL